MTDPQPEPANHNDVEATQPSDPVPGPEAGSSPDPAQAIQEAAAEVDRLAEEAGSAAARPVNLPDFSSGGAGEDVSNIGLLGDVDLDVRIELGRTRMLVDDVLRLSPESVVELDKAAGDPVDIYVNGRHVARGEVLVLNENFCVRVSEIVGRMPETEAEAG